MRAKTDNLLASMEQLQRRVEGRSTFVRGERFADLGSVGELEGPLPARRVAGSGFVPAGFHSLEAVTVAIYQLKESVRIRPRVALPSRSRMCHFFTALKRSFLR